MPAHVAIPEPTSSDAAYNQRSLPQYLSAMHSAGLVPVVIPLHERPDRIAKILNGVQGILLPGSGFDVDPQRYGEDRIPACADADPPRTAVDELLLQDAFNLHKPVLAICLGIQTLNVWLNGTLVQDLKTPVNHTPGRTVADAHSIKIAPNSRLAAMLSPAETSGVKVNSSHHQAVKVSGDNLLVSAFCPADDVIEALELDSRDHFVVGVQWHPERTYTQSELSRAIFASFAHAVETWTPRVIEAPFSVL